MEGWLERAEKRAVEGGALSCRTTPIRKNAASVFAIRSLDAMPRYLIAAVGETVILLPASPFKCFNMDGERV